MSDLEKLFYGNDLIEVATALPKEVETLSGKRILIAGGGGFLGRYFLAIFDHLNELAIEQTNSLLLEEENEESYYINIDVLNSLLSNLAS